MFALLRQLSKLLLLVFNLPQVLNLLGNLFKVTPKDGRLELGIVNTIAEYVVTTQTNQLRQDIESGKAKQIEEVEQETEELKELYSDLSPEARAWATQQAESRRIRRIQQIQNTDPDSIINEELISQMVESKKQELEPAVTPALAPFTALLGIPVFLQKLTEYVPSAGGLAGGVVGKDTADGRADSYVSEFDDGTGDIFNGPVGEGDLEVVFNGLDNNQDFRLFSYPNNPDRVTLEVTSEYVGNLTADISNYGELNGNEELIRNLLTVTVDNNIVTVVAEDLSVGSVLARSGLRDRYGTDTDTEIVVRIRDGAGDITLVTIPTEISTSETVN